MAVGVIIGAAFGKIVSSLVGDIFLPVLGAITGKMNFAELKFTAGEQIGVPVVISYGTFLQSLIDFLIVAFALFWVVKAMARFHATAPSEGPAAPSEEVKLLSEIRDLLKSR